MSVNEKRDSMMRTLTIALLIGLIGQGLLMWRDQHAMKKEIVALQHDNDPKFWKLHQWEKDEINYLRSFHELELAKWPDLSHVHEDH